MTHKYTGLLLHSHRLTKNLSRIEMAIKLNMSTQYYGKIENGSVGLPPVYFKKTCKALNIDHQYLIDALVSDYRGRISNYL